MTYVVGRPSGRWEVRESVWTAAGPRARTLASFTVLTAEILARCERDTRTRFDRDSVVRSARRAGVPIERDATERLAESLIRDLARGRSIRPGLARRLVDRLAGSAGDDALDPWIGATAADRGRAIHELLGLADRLPPPRPGPLLFPGFRSVRAQ